MCAPFEESKVPQRFTDDVLDLHLRIEGGCRILKDHLDIAPHIAGILALQPRNLLVSEEDLSFGWCMKLHQRAHKRTFSTAAFTDNTEDFSTIYGKCHIVTCRKNFAALKGEAFGDMLDAQDDLTLRLHHNAFLQSVVRRAGVPWCSPSARVQ